MGASNFTQKDPLMVNNCESRKWNGKRKSSYHSLYARYTQKSYIGQNI